MENEDIKQENQPIEETVDFTKPSFTFVPKETHEWRQRGYYLICVTCECQHAVFIGPDKIMVGIDKEGNPTLKSRKELGMA